MCLVEGTALHTIATWDYHYAKIFPALLLQTMKYLVDEAGASITKRAIYLKRRQSEPSKTYTLLSLVVAHWEVINPEFLDWLKERTLKAGVEENGVIAVQLLSSPAPTRTWKRTRKPLSLSSRRFGPRKLLKSPFPMRKWRKKRKALRRMNSLQMISLAPMKMQKRGGKRLYLAPSPSFRLVCLFTSMDVWSPRVGDEANAPLPIPRATSLKNRAVSEGLYLRTAQAIREKKEATSRMTPASISRERRDQNLAKE
ncbi:hypothetical protein BCR34DRAFT_553888 [Clohesyomyces aquaticus]|uniref:Uncharacterized protein n=1 Tax=Clohesyomyces aquaticus TaxID=1231657 RepID=A0A1Y2A8F3_9PLEO|nr:hypothetical protein BCR34DRAFT_553888 [Clohesyomyces aquaticus]